MQLPRLARLALVLLGLLMVPTGCDDPESPEPTTEYLFALAMSSCGPADGPAVEIFLTPAETTDVPTEPPYLRLYLTKSPAELEGRTWTWPALDQTVSASECTASAGDCPASPSGAIALGEFAADSSIFVAVDMQRDDGRRVQGQATARWLNRLIICG